MLVGIWLHTVGNWRKGNLTATSKTQLTPEPEILNPKLQQHSQDALTAWILLHFSLHKLLPLLLRRIQAIVGRLGLILMGAHILDLRSRYFCLQRGVHVHLLVRVVILMLDYLCVFVCPCVCVFVVHRLCMYMYYTHANKQTNKQTNIHTYIHTYIHKHTNIRIHV